MNTEDFVFRKVEGGYCLTDYTGKEKEIDYIEIPEFFLDEPVVELGENAFWKAIFLKNVRIPTTVTKLGARCFWACEKLAEIYIPDSVKVLGRRVFDGCKSLRWVRLPSQIQEIPSGLFQYCAQLVKIDIPDPVTVIGEAAFFHCHGLEEVDFSRSLNIIKAQAFERCYRMTRLQFPETLEKIGDFAFSRCYNIVEIHFQQREILCQGNSFVECDYIEKAPLVLMEYLENESQNGLAEHYFPLYDSLSRENQQKLIDNVKKNLHLQKFLFSLNIPEFVGILLRNQVHPTLEEVDFYLEQSIEKKSVEVNAMLLHYKEHHFSHAERSAYEQRRELLAMGFDYPTQAEFGKKWVYRGLSGGTYIMGYKGVLQEEIIPSQFGEGREIVGLMKGKKHDYSSLERIVMERGIQYMEKNCFANHDRLKEVVLSSTLQKLEENVFYGCIALEEMEIPASVTSIANYAFGECFSLKQVIFFGKRPVIHPEAFMGCGELLFVGEENGENIVGEFEI